MGFADGTLPIGKEFSVGREAPSKIPTCDRLIRDKHQQKRMHTHASPSKAQAFQIKKT